MKKIITLSCFMFIVALPSWALAWANDVYVNGYTNDNGTYVQPYHRSAPDNTTANNYSNHGNTNLYTGQQGLTHGNTGLSNNYNSRTSTGTLRSPRMDWHNGGGVGRIQ